MKLQWKQQCMKQQVTGLSPLDGVTCFSVKDTSAMQRKAPVGQAIGLFCSLQQETPDNKVPSCAMLLYAVKVEIRSELSMSCASRILVLRENSWTSFLTVFSFLLVSNEKWILAGLQNFKALTLAALLHLIRFIYMYAYSRHVQMHWVEHFDA